MSLREKLFGKQGDLRNRLAGVAVLGAGAVTRSTELTSKGVEMVTAKKAEPAPIPEPKKFDPATDLESQNQRMIARNAGYDSDPVGNRTSRLPLQDRLEIAKTSPGTLNELLNDEERKLVKVDVVEDKNILDTVKRKLSGKDKEVKVTVPVEPREVQIKTVISKPKLAEDSKLKNVPENFWDSIGKAAKHTGINPKKLAAQLGAESSFNPQATGTSGEIGMPQFMPAAIETVKSYWPQNFGKQYGEFDVSNPEHQILGYAVLTNYNKNHLLPSLGVENPTEEEVALAHNSPLLAQLWHLKRFDEVLNVAGTKKTVKQQGEDYLNLLKQNGWEEQ